MNYSQTQKKKIIYYNIDTKEIVILNENTKKIKTYKIYNL